METKKIYWYNDGEQIISSHKIPNTGITYIEKTIGLIGVPEMRAISIKTSDGKLLYNNIETIPLDDNLIEKYLKEVSK
jgi:hypothetical protein